MQPYSYIDIHKHGHASSPSNDVLVIQNMHQHFEDASAEIYCSMGIHPWHIYNIEEQYEVLKKEAIRKNVIAIGECGLDHIKGASPELQLKAFEMQIHLANKLNKPLIIHCVKAYPEAFLLLKKAQVPVVFHGFNKRSSIANEILQHGYFLSFGEALLHETSAAYQSFTEVPLSSVFFETDDSAIDIKEIYKAASILQKTDIDVIILRVLENFKTVFNL